MTGIGTKRGAITLMTGAALALSACGGEAEVAEAPVEGVIEGVTIENARMVLGPVEGNPAAVYFDFSYEGDRAFSLGRVEVEGAESALIHQFTEYGGQMEMHEAVPISVTNGTSIEFKPGDYHIMAMEPSADLQPGGTTTVTLKISGGDTQEFEAEIRAAGDER